MNETNWKFDPKLNTQVDYSDDCESKKEFATV